MTKGEATGGARLVGWIVRERLYAPAGPAGAVLYRVCGEDWPASELPDVCVPIYALPDGRYSDSCGGVPLDGSSAYPRCSDCGDLRAVLVWSEAAGTWRAPGGARRAGVCLRIRGIRRLPAGIGVSGIRGACRAAGGRR